MSRRTLNRVVDVSDRAVLAVESALRRCPTLIGAHRAMFVEPSPRLSSFVLDLTSSIWPISDSELDRGPHLKAVAAHLGRAYRRISNDVSLPGGSGAQSESHFRR